MRQIGTITGEDAARRFSDLLLVEGIAHQVDAGGNGSFTIWIHEEARIADAAELFESWQEEPAIAERPEVEARAERIRRERSKEIARAKKIVARARPRPLGGIAPVTLALIGASILVAILTKLGDHSAMVRWFTITDFEPPRYVANPKWQDIRAGEIWRLVTPIFLHFGWMHILFNLWWTKDLGTAIERHHGLRVFLPLLVLTAVLPNIAQYMYGPTPAFGGMSGVVYGLLGYIWIRGKLDPLSGLHLPQQIVMFMILWFFLGVFEVIPHIANWAHGVGLGVGMAFGFVMAKLFPSFRLR